MGATLLELGKYLLVTILIILSIYVLTRVVSWAAVRSYFGVKRKLMQKELDKLRKEGKDRRRG